MSLTRRQFVGSGAAALWGLGRSPTVDTHTRCIVLDLREHCGLRESVAGFRSASASLNRAPRLPALIVPAAVEIPTPAVRAIVRCLQVGGTVIVESGAGFADARRFDAHRAVLHNFLDVHVGPSVDLWPRHVPYVDYTWPPPHGAKLRDFSRVVPLERAHAGEVIASADGLPVALRRRSSRGTLIFLGSPLGPALWAGDAEAKHWLEEALLAAPHER